MNKDPAKWGDYIEDEFQMSSKRKGFQGVRSFQRRLWHRG